MHKVGSSIIVNIVAGCFSCLDAKGTLSRTEDVYIAIDKLQELVLDGKGYRFCETLRYQ